MPLEYYREHASGILQGACLWNTTGSMPLEYYREHAFGILQGACLWNTTGSMPLLAHNHSFEMHGGPEALLSPTMCGEVVCEDGNATS